MEPVSDLLARTLIEQTFKTNKDKKQQSFKQKYNNSQKTLINKTKLEKSNLNTAESELSVERRNNEDRRQTRQQQHRFDLRTKHDRRENSVFSLKI